MFNIYSLSCDVVDNIVNKGCPFCGKDVTALDAIFMNIGLSRSKGNQTYELYHEQCDTKCERLRNERL